ncbi:MAG: hypothetical protein V4681_03150 [Patescibacteria group bacterium]
MRFLYALFIPALLCATNVDAEEQKDPSFYATPSVSGEPWKPLDFSSASQAPVTSPLYVPPLAINDAKATGPVSVRIMPYRHLQDRLYEARDSYDEGQEIFIEYRPYPQSAFARIGLKLWDDVWDGKRIREEVRGGARSPLLRTPDEKSGKLEFVFPLCYGRVKC